MTTTDRSGTACNPFAGPSMRERFATANAWTYLLGTGEGRAGARTRDSRAETASRRAEVRATLRAGRDVGAPHTWPVFARMAETAR